MCAAKEPRLTTLTLGEGSHAVLDTSSGDVLPYAFRTVEDARTLIRDANAYYASPYRRELSPENFLRTWLIGRGEEPPSLPSPAEPARLKLVRL